MIHIHLHGSLRDLVDPALLPLRLDVKSPGEAYLALRSQIEGFQTAIDQGNWAWLVDDCETVTQEDVGLLLPAGASLHIYPVAEGDGFIIDFFLGVFSFIGSLFFPSIGDYGDRDHPEERASYLFNGPVNTREQGGVVPVVYGGPIEVGSYTISAGVSSARLTPARSGLPTGNIKGKAKEFENTLQTGATIRIVDLISEGEIEGLVDGAQGVFINGVPVEDADGNEVAAVGTPEPTTDFHLPYGLGAGGYYRGAAAAPANANYKGITVDSRNGTASQTPLDGIPAIETERVVNRQVTATTSIVEAVNAADVDAVRVTIRFPRLTQVTKKADTIPAMVTFAIDIQASGDADYTTALEQTIHDKNISPAEISYEINLKDRGDAPYNVRVRRISADSGSDRLHNQTWWARLTEIKEVRQSYPHSAVVGIVAEAEHFNGDIGKRKYNIKGKIVQVPSNYDPVARTYTGIWDGTFKRAWTDNGAWCVYDMLIHRRYGLGQDIEEEYLAATKWAFYTIAQFNDAAVNYTSASAPSDFNQDRFEFVQGKSEPRFRFTGVIQKAADAKKLIDNMLSNFHAAVYYGGGAVVPVQDSPADPEFLLSNSNVEDGDFHYSDLAYSERFSVVNVSFNDPADGYRLGIEQVFDRALITKYGYKVKDIVSMFNTSRGQARRHGLLYLFEQEHESDSASAIAGLDQATTRPGAVGRVADRLVAAARTGLRLVSIDAARTTLRLDDMSDLATVVGGSWTANVVLENGDVARETVSSFKPAENKIVLASPLDPAPADGAVVVLEQAAVQARLWRAIGVKEQDEGLGYELALKAYHPDKYTSVETGVTVITPDYRLDGSERYTPLPALTSVTLTRSRINEDAVLSDRLSISVVSADEQTYLVDYQVRGPYADGAESDTLWSPLTRSPLRTLDVPGRLEAGNYRARARLVNDTLTARGPWKESGEVVVSDSELLPGLDGADGGEYEYVFCARATAAAITGAANLPDPDWNFDIPGLATANGVTRGQNKYFDGTPGDLSGAKPFVVRFKRRVRGFPAQDEDIGTVAWEQEPAFRLWGKGALPGAGRILVYDDQESGSLTAAGQYKFSNAAAFSGNSVITPANVKAAAYLYVHKQDAGGTDQSHYYDEVQAGDVVVWFDDNDFWMEWFITAKQKTGDVYRFALTFIESIEEDAHNLADGDVDLRFSRAPAGLDGADGGEYEYVFCARATAAAITGAANLPDPDWNFDIPGLATANGVTRGQNKYFDGTPGDLSGAKPFVVRFKRRVRGFPAQDEDIGTVAWEQEPAFRLWGKGALPGAGRILVYDDQESGSLTAAGQYKFSNAAAFSGNSVITPANVKAAAYLYVHKQDAGGTDQSHYYDEVQAGDVVVWFDDNDFWMEWFITAKQKTGDVYRFALTFIESIEEDAHNLADGDVDLRFSRAPAGLDGADGGEYEYVFCARATAAAITGAANLPDPDWNFDIPGLATANGVTRGQNKYFDGTPKDLDGTRPYVVRFKRRVQGFPAQDEDIGTVAWEQEKAYRQWGRDGRAGVAGIRGLTGYIKRIVLGTFESSIGAVNADKDWHIPSADVPANGWTARNVDFYFRTDDDADKALFNFLETGALVTLYIDKNNWADYEFGGISFGNDRYHISGMTLVESVGSLATDGAMEIRLTAANVVYRNLWSGTAVVPLDPLLTTNASTPFEIDLPDDIDIDDFDHIVATAYLDGHISIEMLVETMYEVGDTITLSEVFSGLSVLAGNPAVPNSVYYVRIFKTAGRDALRIIGSYPSGSTKRSFQLFSIDAVKKSLAAGEQEIVVPAAAQLTLDDSGTVQIQEGKSQAFGFSIGQAVSANVVVACRLTGSGAGSDVSFASGSSDTSESVTIRAGNTDGSVIVHARDVDASDNATLTVSTTSTLIEAGHRSDSVVIDPVAGPTEVSLDLQQSGTITIDEGDSETFTYALSEAVASAVGLTATLSGSGAGSALSFSSSGSSTSLTRTIPANRTTGPDITVYARSDSDEDDETVTLTITTTSSEVADQSDSVRVRAVDDDGPVYEATLTTGLGGYQGAADNQWVSGYGRRRSSSGGFNISAFGSLRVTDSDTEVDVEELRGGKARPTSGGFQGAVQVFMPQNTPNSNATFSRMVLTRGNESISLNRSSATYTASFRSSDWNVDSRSYARWIWRQADADNDIFPYSTTGASVTVEFYR